MNCGLLLYETPEALKKSELLAAFPLQPGVEIMSRWSLRWKTPHTLRFDGREPLVVGSNRVIARVEVGCGEGLDSKS